MSTFDIARLICRGLAVWCFAQAAPGLFSYVVGAVLHAAGAVRSGSFEFNDLLQAGSPSVVTLGLAVVLWNLADTIAGRMVLASGRLGSSPSPAPSDSAAVRSGLAVTDIDTSNPAPSGAGTQSGVVSRRDPEVTIAITADELFSVLVAVAGVQALADGMFWLAMVICPRFLSLGNTRTYDESTSLLYGLIHSALGLWLMLGSRGLTRWVASMRDWNRWERRENG